MRHVLSCSCGECREYVVVLQDTVTVAVLTVREVVSRSQEENRKI